MEYEYHFSVDFSVPSGIAKIIRVKQGDALSRVFIVDLLRDGEPYIPASGNSTYLRCEKPGGVTVEVLPNNITGNRALFQIPATATDAPGKCICDICVDDSGDVLSSESFIVFVHQSPGYVS